MSVMADLHWFYVSKPWRDLAYRLKVERGGQCARCSFVAASRADWGKLIAHHTVELDESNIYDPEVALNPELIEVVCLDCHNQAHRRFGHKRKVYIIWGPPLAGKTTLVRELMRAGDIVLDIDALWQAVTLQPEYVKPDNVRYNIFALRDNLLDQIKTRHGQWYDAYVLGGYPDLSERERLASSLGAELIYCPATIEECKARRLAADRPEAWDDYIYDWFRSFERTGGIPPGSGEK